MQVASYLAVLSMAQRVSGESAVMLASQEAGSDMANRSSKARAQHIHDVMSVYELNSKLTSIRELLSGIERLLEAYGDEGEQAVNHLERTVDMQLEEVREFVTTWLEQRAQRESPEGRERGQRANRPNER